MKSLSFRRTARLGATLRLLLLAPLLVLGCLDDRGVGPQPPSTRLALRAQLGALAVTELRLEGAYARSDQSSGALATQSLALPAGATPGTSVELPVTIDLAPCLADPLSVPGAGACTVTLTLVLLDGARELDRVIIGPLTLRPGETSTPAPVQLREAASVSVSASSTSPLLPGQTVQLSATLLDASGAALDGRAFAWASGTPGVATVDAASGLVTAVAPGTSVVSASAGGRTGQLSVTVRHNGQIALSRSTIAFEGYTDAEPSAAQSVGITNAAEGTLGGLAVGAISYSPGPTGWLSATLSSATAPATLTLQPSRTDLPEGTYTASVPVQSADAANSPQLVTVVYTVTDYSQYELYVGTSAQHLFYPGDSLYMDVYLVEPNSESTLDGVPVSWSVNPADAGTFIPSAVTGETALYIAGSAPTVVTFTVSVGPYAAVVSVDQNLGVTRRERYTAPPPSATAPSAPAPSGLHPLLDAARPFTPAPARAPWETR